MSAEFYAKITKVNLDLLIKTLTENTRDMQRNGADAEHLKRLNARIQELEEMKR